ncbi:CDP-diacylglycerol--glycerol-3-phosphate 3-phosphatidyltransferase-like [Oscarella lobularis]|uniref:CDP-diacylglycerol--glycerol-3-phosphate 3-phosphatidyltransferase-like n=1 Tax=Oscarella lobularis TaxID=121494 RepID=UPI003313A420
MTSVFFFLPNLIGYARLSLLLVSFVFFDFPILFLFIYGLSAALDGFDGYVARKWKQTSAFGAWLDVVTDNISRSMVWCHITSWGFFVSGLEWCVFVCTHTYGSQWKNEFDKAPWWAKKIMAHGFKTLHGFVAITGLFVLPLWIYGMQHGLHRPFPAWFYLGGLAFLVIGRLMSLAVEIWCIWNHIKLLAREN